MASPAILAENLDKHFPPAESGWRAALQPFTRQTVPALRGVSFCVERGESVALVGANGAGKSTLLRLLATLLHPTRGRAKICGADVVENPAAVRVKIGYGAGIEQGFYGRLTGRENLRLFAALNNLSRADSHSRIQQLSDLLELHDFLDRQTRTCSTGMLQRLGLARALLHSPQVLLLDEPTRSLDSVSAAAFRRYLKSEAIGRLGAALLFASHTIGEVEEIADRIILLSEGSVSFFGTPAALCSATRHERLEDAIKSFMPTGPDRQE